MQAKATIFEPVTRAYVAYRGVRLLSVLGALCAILVLVRLSGGFPPWAWRLLAQALTHLPALLMFHGQGVLLALFGLILLSFTILLAWCGLLWLVWRMLAYWWYERQELHQFAAERAEALVLAEGEQGLRAEQAFSYAEYEDEEEEINEPASVAQNWSRVRTDEFLAAPEALPRRSAELFAPLFSAKLDAKGPPQTGQEDHRLASQERKVETPGEIAAIQSLHPVHLINLPFTEAQHTEYAANPAQVNPIHHTLYGGFAPLPPVMPPETPPRLHTVLYENKELPTMPLSPAVPDVDTHKLTIQLVVNTGLDVGLKRRGKPNEDSILALQNTRILRDCSNPVGLFVVADGMGGHDNGQRASHMVIQSLSKTVVPSVIYGPTDDNYAELLAEGIHHANLEVYQRNREEHVDMGTTVTAALVVNTTAYIANVGDSRVYLYRASSGLSQITRDHSTVARLVESGAIKPEEIYTHPRRNEIYRSLGRRSSEDIDTFTVALQPEDMLLLCSDGLWEMVRDADIREIIESTWSKPAQLSPALVQAALDGGGKDNISLIAVHIKLQVEQAAAWAG